MATLSELKPGAQLDMTVLVSRCQVKQTRKGSTYFELTVRDKTDSLEARWWDPRPDTEPPVAGNFIRLQGSIEDFRGENQVKVSDLTYVEAANVQMSDFLPCSERDPEAMHAQLVELVRTRISTEPLRAMLVDMLTDAKIKPVLLSSPAAKFYHHSYMGGLLTHILSLWDLAEGVALHYGDLMNSDLLLSYCVLHDFAKVKELSVDLGFAYTPIGALVGHVIIGAHLVWHYARKHKVSEDITIKLLHGVASHHGEFGDIKPRTIEAIAFHFLDNLDAKIEGVRVALLEDKTGLPAVNVPILRGEVYR